VVSLAGSRTETSPKEHTSVSRYLCRSCPDESRRATSAVAGDAPVDALADVVCPPAARPPQMPRSWTGRGSDGWAEPRSWTRCATPPAVEDSVVGKGRDGLPAGEDWSWTGRDASGGWRTQRDQGATPRRGRTRSGQGRGASGGGARSLGCALTAVEAAIVDTGAVSAPPKPRAAMRHGSGGPADASSATRLRPSMIPDVAPVIRPADHKVPARRIRRGSPGRAVAGWA